MSSKRNIFIIFLTIILVITTIVLYNKKDISADADSGIKKIWDIDQTKIVEICMENKDGKFVFQKSQEQWKAIEPANLKFDKMRIDGILYTLANLDIMGVIDENPKDIEQYGLSKPSSITVKMQNDKLYTLEIGNVTALKNGYYVKVKNEPTVYKVNNGVGEELLRGKKDFRDRRIFDFQEEDFIGFQLEKGDKILLYVEKNGTSWKVEPPLNGKVDIKRLDPLLTTLSYLCVNDYVEDDANDLEKYGLSKPKFTLKLKTTKFNKTLYLGNEIEKAGYIYGKIDDSKDVLIFRISDLSFIYNPSRSGFTFSE